MADVILENDPLDALIDPVSGDVVIDPVKGPTFVSGINGVAQLIRIAVRLFLGEWFLNLKKGMPWFQEILGEKFDEALLRTRLTEVILAVPATISIISMVITPDPQDRSVSVSAVVETIFGDTPIDTLKVGGS